MWRAGQEQTGGFWAGWPREIGNWGRLRRDGRAGQEQTGGIWGRTVARDSQPGEVDAEAAALKQQTLGGCRGGSGTVVRGETAVIVRDD